MIVVHEAATRSWLRFDAPLEVIGASHAGEVQDAVDEVARRVEEKGLYAAGFVSYEAAPAFDPACVARPPDAFPLVWFGLFREPTRLAALPNPVRESAAPPAEPGLRWRADPSYEAYAAHVARVHAEIAAGNTYQVNLTFRLRAAFAGDPWPLFTQLHAAQGGAYSAYLDAGRFAILSLSPELFFTLDGDRLACRPMKGTAPRGRWLHEDLERAASLAASPKDRAENVMIVDMVRNDLGRMAEPGSIEVPHLFQTERYPTLWQMTSTVTARSRAPFGQILAALFPCASVTGAPKVSTMRLIAELEDAPRRVYTGAAGFLAPGRRAQFNVAIRTVIVDRERGEAEYGVGSGIVWDSTPAAEWQECRTKALVLAERRAPFRLLETLHLASGGSYALLERHLARLAASAAYFGFAFDARGAERALAEHARHHAGHPRRVRALLPAGGDMVVESEPHVERTGVLKVAVSPLGVDSADPMLQHKTTRRECYQRALASCPGVDEVLLLNERGELTEACTANVVLDLDGVLVTPARHCGLLAGTFREELLTRGEVREAVLTADALRRARRFWLVNSVRFWMEAELAAVAEAAPAR